MSTRSVSVGTAITAFFCLSTIVGFAVVLLLASDISVRAEDDQGIDADAAIRTEAGDLERQVRQIEIHTKKEVDIANADIPFDTVEEEILVDKDGLIVTPETVYESRRIILGIDRAELLRLNGAVETIVIGNPVIADAAVYDQSTLVLTGKAFGETNIIVLDSMGNILREAEIRVGQPNDVVVVNRGASQTTYSCAPHCSRTLRIGDNAEGFDATLSQTQAIIELNQGGQAAR
ncbi:MAG: pilus assembly protein N-terminal domain-containing protein [Pseudomonadota bacterium]